METCWNSQLWTEQGLSEKRGRNLSFLGGAGLTAYEFVFKGGKRSLRGHLTAGRLRGKDLTPKAGLIPRHLSRCLQAFLCSDRVTTVLSGANVPLPCPQSPPQLCPSPHPHQMPLLPQGTEEEWAHNWLAGISCGAWLLGAQM